jgi:ClpP class serine protease
VARPESILGSIGVISARLIASDFFDRVSVRAEVVKTSPFGDLHAPRVLAPEEAALLEAETQRYYERFMQVVAEGRKRTREEIEVLAGGRVWSGEDAFRHGLIDALGGYAEARAALDVALGDEAGDVDRDPLVVEPALRTGQVDALGQAAASLGFGEGLDRLRDELSLFAGGERVFAYARDLPIP